MIILYLLLLLSQTPPINRQPEIRKILQCTKIKSGQLNVTVLNCGQDSLHQDIILEIPETYATFPKGDVFTVNVYKDNSSEFAPKQPKGSVVYLAPPCPAYRIRPAQAKPCNPELTR